MEVATTALTSVDGGATMAHVVTERIGEDGRVELAVAGIGSDTPVPPFATRSRPVGHYVRTRVALMEASAYRRREVAPIPKARRAVPVVACPACDAEGWADCALCHGRGGVPTDAAEAWRVERWGGGEDV